MTFQLTQFSGQFDLLDLILATIALILLLFIIFRKPPKKIETESANDNKPIAADKITPDNHLPVDNSAALQVLSLLQQNGRFIDFIHEDLSQFSDAEIGAAARVVHQGSQKILQQHFSFSSICNQEEESRVTLDQGFNAQEFQLTGQVTGHAPFTGTLIHKGWRVDTCHLPTMAEGHDCHIIAKAEVEL